MQCLLLSCRPDHTGLLAFFNMYSVQLKNMYSYLNSSLKLSDILRGSRVNNAIATG